MARHGIIVTWCFYATSHGKSTCDAIGAHVKRCAVKASLQRPVENQITDAYKLFDFCQTSELSKTVQFLFISKADVDLRRETDKKIVGLPIPGTR